MKSRSDWMIRLRATDDAMAMVNRLPARAAPNGVRLRRVLIASVTAVAAGVAAVVLFGLLRAPAPDQAGPDIAFGVDPDDATRLVVEWVTGALAGQFDQVAALTYGEFGEPAALDRLAHTVAGYRNRFGVADLDISAYQEVQLPDRIFVCVNIAYGNTRLDGGMVVRDWPDQGVRLWEFRSNMEGCLPAGIGPSITTTQPAA